MMKEHLIFFIDFVGFANATKHWDSQQMAALILLLHNLASLRSEFDLGEQPAENGTRYNIRPAVTTFSDHIVISYPIEGMQKLGGGDTIGTILLLSQRLISGLAAAAMSLGLLIRGGATVGPLYHSGGVVIGTAMIEAYELESKVAVYPRIAVSRKAYSQIKAQPRSSLVLQDDDGITHLNYFTHMILAGGNPPGEDYKKRLTSWLAGARQIISTNIAEFEREERWNELSKWVWFKKHLEQARAGLNNLLFE